jgi:5-formyltetrahydrofolate cyclo-ligase
MDNRKNLIRRHMRAQRSALPPWMVRRAGCQLREAVQDFAPYREAEAVLVYLPIANEVCTAALVADAWTRGLRVYVPHVASLSFHRFEVTTHLRRSAMMTLEPAAGEVFATARGAVAFVPLLAWNVCGHRIGYGGGWYDRALARLQGRVTTVGVGYEFQCYERLPQGAADIALDFIITERRVVRCGINAADPARLGTRRVLWT